MWTTIKNKYKIILSTIGLLIVGIILAFLFEDFYRQLVRFSFKFFNGDNIQFVGKNFHLFASNSFVISFGLFTALTFLLLYNTFQADRLKILSVTVFLFFITTILITALDSKRLIIECTACDQGIRKLTYNELTYDGYFIVSLCVSLLYLFLTLLKQRNRQIRKIR